MKICLPSKSQVSLGPALGKHELFVLNILLFSYLTSAREINVKCLILKCQTGYHKIKYVNKTFRPDNSKGLNVKIFG